MGLIKEMGGFIRDRCYFCLNKRADHTVKDGELYINLCTNCKEQYDEALENSKKSPVLLPRKDPSELCVQCGLCCVLLAARVEEEEVKVLLEQAKKAGIQPIDLLLPQFCTQSKHKPYKGEYLINMPCRYLAGRILSHVNCRAYTIDRPKVCRSYLCKTAIQYRLGLISLPEAMFLLRSSFLKGDVSIFNWDQSGGSKDDFSLDLARQLSDLAQKMRDLGFEEDAIEFGLCARITPVYDPKSMVSHTIFNMHMASVDRDDYELGVFYTSDEIERMTEVERESTIKAIKQVLTNIRELFIRKDEKADDQGSAGEGEEAARSGGSSDGESPKIDEGGKLSTSKSKTHWGGIGFDNCACRSAGDAEGGHDSGGSLCGEKRVDSDVADQQGKCSASGSGDGTD